MLRLLVLLLLLGNATFFAWSQGHLLDWGFGPALQSEPQRLEQQIRPDAVRLLQGDEARRLETAAASAPRAPECLQAGLFDDAQAATLRARLEAWPAGSWSLEAQTEPARWLIYMGRYATTEQLNRKKAELRQRGVSFEPLSNPALELGLSLGGFASESAAVQQLQQLSTRGVRTARVIQEREEQRGMRLVLPAVDDVLRARLDEIRPALSTRTLRACR